MSDEKKKGGSPVVRGGAAFSWLGLTLACAAPSAPWTWVPGVLTGKLVQQAGAPGRILAGKLHMTGGLMILAMHAAALSPLLLVALAPGLIKAKPFKIFFAVWLAAYIGVAAFAAWKGY